MKSDLSFIPNGQSGDYIIDEVVVDSKQLNQILTFMSYGRGVLISGTYKRLRVKTGEDKFETVMSNTPDEMRDAMNFIYSATGKVFISGLGIGAVLQQLLTKPAITKITVIEKSLDVISLVAPYFTDSRLEIIHADTFSYKPNKEDYWDIGWHDIWNFISSENVPEMNKLHSRYKKYIRKQLHWCRSKCLKMKREDDYYDMLMQPFKVYEETFNKKSELIL